MVKMTREQAEKLSDQDLLGALSAGLVEVAEALEIINDRKNAAVSAAENEKSAKMTIKEIFSTKPNWVSVSYSMPGFPTSATVRKWELIQERLKDIMAVVAKVKAVGDDEAKHAALPFARKAKDKREEAPDETETAGNSGSAAASALVGTPGPLQGRVKK